MHIYIKQVQNCYNNKLCKLFDKHSAAISVRNEAMKIAFLMYCGLILAVLILRDILSFMPPLILYWLENIVTLLIVCVADFVHSYECVVCYSAPGGSWSQYACLSLVLIRVRYSCKRICTVENRGYFCEITRRDKCLHRVGYSLWGIEHSRTLQVSRGTVFVWRFKLLDIVENRDGMYIWFGQKIVCKVGMQPRYASALAQLVM